MQLNQTVKGVSAAYYSQILKNGDVPTPIKYTMFNSEKQDPQLKFSKLYYFIYHLFRKAQVEPECLIASVEYLDQFQQTSGCLLTYKNYYKLIFVAIQVASKVWDDVSCSSKSFSMCSNNFTLKQLNQYERVFCEVLNYDLFLDSQDYRNYYYDMKKMWLCLDTTPVMEIRGWVEQQCNGTPSVSKWDEWGVDQFKNIVGGDVKQIQSVGLSMKDLQ